MGLFAFSPLFYITSVNIPSAHATIDCSGSSGGITLKTDPNTGLCLPNNGTATPTSASVLILRGINIMLGLATVVAIFFIVWGGFQYIFSAGNQEKAEAGQRTVTDALIGLVIIVLAFLIVSIINHTLSSCVNSAIGC